MRTEQKQNSIPVPLAAAMRPRKLDDFVGHASVLGQNTALRRAIEQGTIGSLILWGPPGVGKTTLAEIIARRKNAAIERVSATSAGVSDLRDVLARAREWQKIARHTVLIVDEIHRFHKNQQDVLLPAVEEGLITMIGATTENPHFEVVSALVSRAPVIRLEILSSDDIAAIIQRAATAQGIRALSQKVLANIGEASGGDARRALTILEYALAGRGNTERKSITLPDVQSAAQVSSTHYDKRGDIHYDTISAYIKSLRGSDADAALFYLFRMLVAGEDTKFIIRRMFIFASEDIGNGDPHALMLVSAAAHALEWVGLPEAEYSLAHATCYLAAAPKSNSVTSAMIAVKEDVRLHGNDAPPGHITGKNIHYKYPHEYPGHVVSQQYRPSAIQQNIYYQPGDEGFEKEVKRRLDAARRVLYCE